MQVRESELCLGSRVHLADLTCHAGCLVKAAGSEGPLLALELPFPSQLVEIADDNAISTAQRQRLGGIEMFFGDIPLRQMKLSESPLCHAGSIVCPVPVPPHWI